jgi:hypothetical protein
MSIYLRASRAQHGMYIVGNATSASSVEMWKCVIDLLKTRNQLDTSLRLRCPRHEDERLFVSNPADFEVVSPEGGCSKACGQRLKCGHTCEFLCHADARHQISDCKKPCERGRPSCGHACPKRCSDPCGLCNVPMPNIKLRCGHIAKELPCHQAQAIADTIIRCPIKVTRTLRCGHEMEMECWKPEKDAKCTSVCGGLLACGHICSNPCHKCNMLSSDENDSKQHAPCPKICNKDYKVCTHRCSRRCHDGDCGPCQHKCELRCVHSRCVGICGQDCAPCAEACTWSCKHLGRCIMPCGAPCSRLPCNYRCSGLLKCGHQCPSICGETCPEVDFCQQCCSPKVKDTVVDFLEYSTYEKINLDEDPIIVLPCKHFFTRSSLDGTFDIGSVYDTDANGDFVASRRSGSLASQHVRCPNCRLPVSQIQRYNRITKAAILESLLKTLISRSHQAYYVLLDQYEQFRNDMDANREEKMSKFTRNPPKRTPIQYQNINIIYHRGREFGALRQRVKQFLRDVDESNQPHVKVYTNAIAAFSRANASVKTRSGLELARQIDVPTPDRKHRILGSLLEARLNHFQYADRLQMADKLSSLEGCREDSYPLYQEISERCKDIAKKADKVKSECDQLEYPQHAVDILLLQAELKVIEIRCAQVIKNPEIKKSEISQLRTNGLKFLEDCAPYFQRYQSCRKFEDAVSRARNMLQGATPFYEAVSLAERKAIDGAMRHEFGQRVSWYYCRNRHPVL